ncbi:MAG: glycosyltransferase [Acidimicrobiales bacterium]|jgi:GT2 family glycosyltransferase|nr:glycosyltransferase [Acidimicrobiales bacterium]
MSAAPVTVIIIHRNRPDAIARTVEAFRAQTAATDVTVIDNGSEAATVAALPELVGDAELVITGANLGFGPGGNVGIRRFLAGEGEWVAIAPHDALPDPDTIETMLAEVADRPDVGLMSADVGDGMRPIIQPYLGTIDAPPTVESGFDPADYPHGTLMMCRRACLDEVGIFDERYFAYCEESELAIRATRAGWTCGVIRGARVRNPGMSASIERVAYLQLRNTLLMLRNHYGRKNAWFRIGVALIQIPVGMVHVPSRGLHWSPRGRLLAIRDYLRGRFGPPPDDVGGG